jgi:hypothetical protein
MLKQVQHDNYLLSHHETKLYCHPELVSGSTVLLKRLRKNEMLKQVQHDNYLLSHHETKPYCHPELVSGSTVLLKRLRKNEMLKYPELSSGLHDNLR